MKLNIFKSGLLFLITVLHISCSDYLDVQPEDKLLESQIYSTEEGTNGVLNRVYLDLTSSDLYGGNLTMSTVELLAQRYNVPDSRWTYYNFANYNYQQNNVKSNFEAIWSSAYNNILNLNDLIVNVDEYNTLTPFKTNLIKGEAYGLRAMLHFDLLRLFGPIYDEAPENSSIPYYTKAQAKNGEILSANIVLDNVIADLLKAEEFLMDDPIRVEGVSNQSIEDVFYYHNRNLRLNYFAVKALQARVYLYAGKIPEANAAAKTVIDNASTFFPWTPPADVISAGANPDRTFSREVIFGMQNVELYERQNRYFSSSLIDSDILAPNASRLSGVFESNENDYRYNSTWILPAEKSYRTFYKYADVSDSHKAFRYLQPLIRISEMYYIAAETETDEALALQYLNTVRFNRGLVDLGPGANVDAELEKEYQKEFFGEGQLFFYYKRKNVSRILNGSSTSSFSRKTMTEDQYVLPLPDSETKYQ
ncbi:RagB/SusD family nutrient uptake outer membrane protein [Aestuariibaculum sp. YM273]|uniref:RagB/SusD family nutrient uptake outer membrane protein n=1 Tax=Aestuariibaculum sp. YM273 TaxID=3070659 RepID=UPI0027DC4ADA|nr:RagB/SusD family nutrient uptake outer membrane protein [Aestuariibaculum sp. YM273]WMI64127.1 RagB/SusD family nutrient uptake outer membrane protein [Aestuariibaculum sp. YM273]